MRALKSTQGLPTGLNTRCHDTQQRHDAADESRQRPRADPSSHNMSLASLPRDALDALETIASNLQREPQNPKFRTLRLSNAAVQRRLGSHAARAALAGLGFVKREDAMTCLLYTSPSPRDRQKSRMPSSA